MFILRKMFEESSGLNDREKRLWGKSIVILTLLFCVSYPLFADAYLAQDKVYYGADSYFINYEDEIIKAKGNAYFKKEKTDVFAREIVIYYSEKIKKAFFYGNVRIIDKQMKVEVRGNYGEAHYKKDYYMVEKNASYTDGVRKIRSRKMESDRGVRYIFTDDVDFNDGEVRIQSDLLELDETDTAYFRNGVFAVFIEEGDELYCRSLKYATDTGNSEFQGDVLYIQKEREEGENNSLIVKSENVQYFHDTDLFLLMDDVYILNSEYSLSGSMVKYFRERGFLESVGETVVNDGKKTVFCNNMTLNLNEKKVSFFGSVKGIFRNSKE